MTVLSAPKGDISRYFANYRGGKSSTERSGISWEALGNLEKNVPELTSKQAIEQQKQA